VSGFEADRAVGRHAWIKTDTSIAPGNSGGAAFDAGGSLIGVPTAGVTSTDCHGNSCATVGSINLVRPIDFAKDLVRRATTAQPIPFGDPRLDYGRLDAGSGSGA
jgi:S1-C subfamily serine protease